MKIYIAIAAYHGEKFITEQLESLLHQTRVPDEVVIGDDSENSNFEQAVAEFYLNHPTLPFELKYYRIHSSWELMQIFILLRKKQAGILFSFVTRMILGCREK